MTMIHGSTIWRLTQLFLIVKLSQLLIIYYTPVRFDTSSHLLVNQHLSAKRELVDNFWWIPFFNHFIDNVIDKFITWDAVYFTDLYVNPIRFENQFVFCPSWWRLIKYLPIGEGNFYAKLLLSLVVSNTFHYSSVIMMYVMTISYFKNGTHSLKAKYDNQKFSEIASKLMIISQAGVFLTSGYSENQSNLLSFLTVYLHDLSINHNDFKYSSHRSIKSKFLYVLSGTCLAWNFTTRANSMLFGVLYLHDLYVFLVSNKDLNNAIFSIITGSQLFASILGSNVYTYWKFCPARGEWCTSLFPSLFQYAQKEYWNNGLFNYWTTNNIPNFLFALPTILIQSASIKFYLNGNQLPKIKKISSLLLVNIMLLTGVIFFWNTQILTRIGSCMPISYWYVAHLISINSPYAKYIVYYMLAWNAAQSSLFAAFLPPA